MITIKDTITTYEVRYERWDIELTIDGVKVRETERKERCKTFNDVEHAEAEIKRLRARNGKAEMMIASKANTDSQYSVYIERYNVISMSEVTKKTTYYYD